MALHDVADPALGGRGPRWSVPRMAMNLRRDAGGTWPGILRSHPTRYEAGEVRANPDHRLAAFAIASVDGD